MSKMWRGAAAVGAALIAISANAAVGPAAAARADDFSHWLEDVACPTASQCTAIDTGGRAVTFDPTATSAITTGVIDPTGPPRSLACPTTRQCTAVDPSGRVITFDPLAPARASPLQLPGNAGWFIACPSTAQCTAAGGLGEITFDPSGKTLPALAVVDEHPLVQAAECPTLGGCPSTGWIAGIACPTMLQCTVSDSSGFVSSFDPQAPGRPVPVRIHEWGFCGGLCHNDSYLLELACPTQRQCTAVTSTGGALTFDPSKPPNPIVHGMGLETPRDEVKAVACATETRCVAVDTRGRAFSFDPSTPADGVTSTIDTEDELEPVLIAAACPAAQECVAVEAEWGGAVVFDPTGRSRPRRLQIDGPAPHFPTESAPGSARVSGVGRVRRGSLALRLVCLGGPCRGVLSVRARTTLRERPRRAVAIGSARFALASGGSAAVHVRLSPLGDALLRAAGRGGLKVTVTGSGLKAASVRLHRG